MNFKLLSKLLGILLLLESVAMAACGGFAYFDPSPHHEDATIALMTSAGVTAFIGTLLWLSGMGKVERIPRREGMVVVGAGWIFFGLFGALPFILAAPYLDPASALFESISGFTTTGSTVIGSLGEWPRGILLWRAVTQWLGGLGILVLFVALLSSIGVGSKSLFRAESSLQTGEATAARIRDTANSLLKVYLSITALSVCVLSVLGMEWFDAVAHSFTAVSTGGFSPYDASIGHFSSWQTGLWIEIWLSIVMTACSLNFLLFPMIFQGKWKRVRSNEEGRWFLLIVVFSMLVMAAGLCLDGGDWSQFGEHLRQTSFMTISIISTTGYGLADYEIWPAFLLVILASIMLVGGCAGSTAGGLKVSRLLVFLKSLRHDVVRAYRPNQVFRLQMNGRSISENLRAQTVLFVALYGFIFLTGGLAVSLLEAGNGIDLETSFGAVIATLANIGPGFGDVGPTDNFAHLRPMTKVFLSMLMILGRLELFAILVMFVPALWRKY